tara:strand:- start:514 stop:1104 length:591 start_codon:yes stop_codon:yes gene_type:complete
MPDYSKRTGYAPWSLTREAGVQSATVNGTIEVPQTCQPTINTGVIDEKGNWQGVKADDEVFIGLTKAEAIANGATVLFPETNNFPSIDMSGFRTLQFALKVTQSGNYSVKAVVGPDTVPFANLSPIAPNVLIRIADNITGTDENLFNDTVAVDYANAWFIVTILADRAKGQKNMQFRVTNDTGSTSNIEFGFRRLV